MAFAIGTNAQVKTETTTHEGNPSQQVTVEKGEVVTVNGNDLFVKMEDGSVRHFPNVPESARVMVEGRELGVHDLQPGMKLERTITVTTTPKTVKTVKTVTGKVFHVSPPNSVVLTLEDGTNQKFDIPRGQKFNINGEEKDAFGLRPGMKISATKITEAPETHVQQEQKVTGSMPPSPPPVPPADQPILIAHIAPMPVLAAEEQLPKTGSMLPLIGLVGSLFVFVGLIIRIVRRSVLKAG
jgi:hypothetical protein